MKKSAVIFFTFLIIVSFSGCSVPSAPKDEVLASLGKYTSKQYYTDGGFQDYTDYAKYTFDSVDFSNNSYFTSLTEDSKADLTAHIDNFEGWIQTIQNTNPENEVVLQYDFDRSVISDADYLYIYDNPAYSEFGCYTVYYFDTETNTLYYFHNNL